MTDFTSRQLLPGGFKSSKNFNVDKNLPYVEVQKNGKNERIYGTPEQLEQYQQNTSNTNNSSVKNGTATVGQDPNAEPNAAIIEAILGQGRAQTNNTESNTINTQSSNNSFNNTVRKDPNLPNIFNNPMEEFASYSSLWTMAILTPEQFNDPEGSYRTEDLSFASDFELNFSTGEINESGIIFSAGGRGDEYRVNTAFGEPEYYIDDFEMNNIIAPTSKVGNTNAIKFSFTVYEPYSMGLLLQSMQVAAIGAGYANYLDNAPYVLRLDIQGYDNNGNVLSSIRPHWFVMKLSKVTFDVDEGGSKYRVEGYPFNHHAYSNTINVLQNDIAIEGGESNTVGELLATSKSSLITYLNRNERKKIQEQKQLYADTYEIQFPGSPNEYIKGETYPTGPNSAVIEKGRSAGTIVGGENVPIQQEILINSISGSPFTFDQSSGGNFTFSQDNEAYDPVSKRLIRDKMQIDPRKRTFHFTQGQSIVDIINKVVLSSKYASDAQDPENLENGMIKWFRIDVQIQFQKYDFKKGDWSKKIIFRVVPYKVHHTQFTNPNSPAIGYNDIRNKVAKKYEYIYSGQNTDVLDFKIELNTNFYTAINSSLEKAARDIVNQNQKGISENPEFETENSIGSDTGSQLSATGTTKLDNLPFGDKDSGRGWGGATVQQIIAETMKKAIESGRDLIQIDLEIHGDPFWLVDSGLANYFADPVDDQVLSDGTCNYEGGMVFVFLKFRTPIEIDTPTGMYKFQEENGSDSVFSGIYRVTKVDNYFSDGYWRQKLRCFRMPKQDNDFVNGRNPAEADKLTSTATRIIQEATPSREVVEENIPLYGPF